MNKIQALNTIAEKRNQSLAQMAIAWLMKDSRVTSVLVGASSVNQLDDNLACLNNLSFSAEELTAIEAILAL
jgi:L-glyceraldehyde 3-phosphate reductase